MTSFEVTETPPKWARPGRRKVSGRKHFYIHADTLRGWPYEATTTLCKLGVTDKNPRVRRDENRLKLQSKWGIESELEVVFVATGTITKVEKAVADHTLGWIPEQFERNAEWRECCPRRLARIAVLIAEKRHRSGYV